MIVSLVILGLFLIFIIVGLVKGFFRQLFGFIGTIASFVLAALFCGKLVDYLVANTDFYVSVKGFFESFLHIDPSATMESLDLPDFIRTFVEQYLAECGGELSEALSSSLARLTLLFGSFLAIALAVKIVCFILGKIFNSIAKSFSLVNAVNRALGAVLGLVKGYLFVCAVLFLIELIPFEFMNAIKEQIALSPVASVILSFNVYGLIFSLFGF